LKFTGIALGSAAALVIYHGMKAIAKARGTVGEPETDQAGLPPAVKSALNAAAKRGPRKR
jgi:NCS2 family nucleobase:cation symporter-2